MKTNTVTLVLIVVALLLRIFTLSSEVYGYLFLNVHEAITNIDIDMLWIVLLCLWARFIIKENEEEAAKKTKTEE